MPASDMADYGKKARASLVINIGLGFIGYRRLVLSACQPCSMERGLG